MLSYVFEWLNGILNQGILPAASGSFIWGVLSIILSPCHLSSLPLIIGYINRNGVSRVRSAFINSLLFSTGILITIIVIGVITGLFGGLIGDIGTAGNYIVSAVFFAAGLFLLGVFKADWDFLSRSKAGEVNLSSPGYLTALVIGLIFGAGLGPCTFAFMAPVLGIVFSTASAEPYRAAILIISFAAGHCAVLAATGTMSAKIFRYFNLAGNSTAMKIFKKTCGVLVILGGFYFLYTAF